VLDNRQFSFDPGMTISGTLVNFGIDASTNEAVVTYDAARAVSGGTGVEERRFEARVPVSEITADTAGVALNDAANRVAGEVATWIGG
jgi:cholesterol transport system auxiliary component